MANSLRLSFELIPEKYDIQNFIVQINGLLPGLKE